MKNKIWDTPKYYIKVCYHTEKERNNKGHILLETDEQLLEKIEELQKQDICFDVYKLNLMKKYYCSD